MFRKQTTSIGVSRESIRYERATYLYKIMVLGWLLWRLDEASTERGYSGSSIISYDSYSMDTRKIPILGWSTYMREKWMTADEIDYCERHKLLARP